MSNYSIQPSLDIVGLIIVHKVLYSMGYYNSQAKDGGIKMKKHLGTLGLLVVAIIWGMGFVANDIALNTMSPLQILCVRFFIGSILMSTICLYKRIKIGKKELLAGILLGIFLFVGFATQTIGLKYTTPAKNAFLTAANVVIVPFIAFMIYKKKVDRFCVIGTIMALMGIGILSLKGDMTLSLGDGLTLICAVCFAFQIFFTGEFVQKFNVITLTTIQMFVSFILSLIAIVAMGEIHFNIGYNALLSTLYLGILSTTVAFILQTYFQKFTDGTTAAIVLSMESVFGTLFSIIIVGEKLTPRMFMGCFLIFFAVIIAETKLNFLFSKNSLEVETE